MSFLMWIKGIFLTQLASSAAYIFLRWDLSNISRKRAMVSSPRELISDIFSCQSWSVWPVRLKSIRLDSFFFDMRLFCWLKLAGRLSWEYINYADFGPDGQGGY